MKKTIRTSFNRDGFLDTVAQRGLEGFAGQEVIITVESAEKEKPKVQMCECGEGCDKPARWLTEGGGGTWHHCNEHLWRAMSLHREGTYKITPLYLVPPQPPEPVVVEGICDNRPDFCLQGAKGTPWYEFPVPHGFEGKCFKYRLEEILPDKP